MGGCRLSTWLGMDVKAPVHVPEGNKRLADPTWNENPAFFAARAGYLADDASARLAKPAASEVHHG
jgi:hypothetical protein